MHVFLPIAHIGINLWLVIALGTGVGLLSGLTGVGGGFLLTPLLLVLGVPPLVAAGSSTAQIVGTSSVGSYGHWRLGNVDFRMAIFLVLGGWAGGAVGVYVAKILERGGHFQTILSFVYLIVLGFVGSAMLIESFNAMRPKRKKEEKNGSGNKKPSVMAKMIDCLPGKIYFPVSGQRMSFVLPVILGMMVGSITSLGISGGFLMVPALIYLMKLPTKVAVGTTLFQLLFIATNVSILQAGMNHAVDPYLVITLVLGSSVGSVVGTRLSSLMKSEHLRLVLAVVVLGVAVQMGLGLILQPSNPFSMNVIY